MTCSGFRDQLLEADLAELQGQVDTVLSRHLAMCDHCQNMANVVVTTERAMNDSLSALTSVAGSRGHRVVTRRKSLWIGMFLPLAAAAGVTGLLLRSSPAPSVVTRAAVPESVAFVESHTHENFAVFNTDNPDIVVVWFFGGDD